MNDCVPSQATELTDVLLNCCTNELTVIQTGADGVEVAVVADLTCLVEKFATLQDAQFDCDTGILSMILASNEECPEQTVVTVDLSCLDTYVTWVDNGNGSVTFTSADGSETIGVMRDCAGIAHQPVTDPTDMVVLCKSDGTTVKGTLEEVVGEAYSICSLDLAQMPILPETIIEFGVCIDGSEYKLNIDILRQIFSGNMEDGLGTNLTGDGSEANPYIVDLDVCELPVEIYDPNAVMTGCIGGQSRNMPAIKAGDNVNIQVDGTLNVNTSQPVCEMPATNYNEQSLLVTCSNGNEVTIPAIKAGTNVTILPDGTLNVAISQEEAPGCLVFVNNGNPITIFSFPERSASNLPYYNNFNVSPWVPSTATGLIVRTYAECDNGGNSSSNMPVEISIRVDNRVINGAETGGSWRYDPAGDNSSWSDAIVPHTPNALNMSIVLHYGDPNIVGYQAKAYLVGYFR